MSLGSFADLANVKVADVEPPKTIPIGHYVAAFAGPMKEHKARSGNTAMRFPFILTEAGEDVDAEALAEAGGLPKDDKGNAKQFALDFWMSPDARFRFTDFGKAMGHSDQLNLLELAEALATSGDQFLIEVKHETDAQDPKKVYTRFDNPAPLAG